MSYPTVPAYIQVFNGWDNKEHPIMDWMQDHEIAFDYGDMKKNGYAPWHTDDFVLTKPTGEVISGGEAAFAAGMEMYAPFAAHYHEPMFGVI